MRARLPALIKRCPGCEKDFVVSRKKPKMKYCSRICYFKDAKGRPKREPRFQKCVLCRKEFKVRGFTRKRVYCSQKCYYKSRKGEERSPRIKRECLGCGTVFQVPIRKPKKKYCSHKCAIKINSQKPRSDETKRKMSESSKRVGVFKRLWKDLEFQKHLYKSRTQRPTQPEKWMEAALNRVCPGEYKYTGNGDFIIDGLNPDFVNVNGQKKLVEVFGAAYHDPKKAFKKVPYRSTYQGRKRVFARFGYKTLIIWDYEMKDTAKVERKIRRFHEL